MDVRAVARDSHQSAQTIPGLGFPVASVTNPLRGTPARMVAAGVNSSMTSDVNDAMRKRRKTAGGV
ncbi:hypothetical protein GGR59_002986 [Xanthomonas arboricola]|nr:hypothetical protein [Xanthomonas arboricola]SOT97115.1 hypothetical protein CFBP6773_01649 [Xanthomonas arboricola pv. fragariae]